MPSGEKGFKKGHDKTGGREKGTKNKRTEQWEEFAEYCMTGGLEKFQEEMNKLKGEKFVHAFINIMEFHKPKLSRTQTEIEIPDNTVKVVKTIINGRG